MNTNNQNGADILAQLVREIWEARKTEMTTRLEVSFQKEELLWHLLLQCFATMGRATGWKGLIGTPSNYERVRYPALLAIPPSERKGEVEAVCRAAKVRMPKTKADFILKSFARIEDLGGLQAAHDQWEAQENRKDKLTFLRGFHGIAEKSARQIMVEKGDPEFKDTILIDSRLKLLIKQMDLGLASYDEAEEYFLKVARDAGLEASEFNALINAGFKDLRQKLLAFYPPLPGTSRSTAGPPPIAE